MNPVRLRAIEELRRIGAATRIAQDRNLAVHMYRGKIGEEIEERLAGHAAVLRRWLDALRERAAEST